jgi:amidase
MSDTTLVQASTSEQARLIKANTVSPAEMVDAAIDRLERTGRQLNVLASERFAKARDEARSSDLPDGPLRGVPILLKDIGCWMEGESDYMGNVLLKSHDSRAPADASLTRRLREAGAIVLGRTTTPEFAIRSTTESLAYGVTSNPWSADHSTGGSSGGSASAVAAGLVSLAQGSDGAGSLRMPASLCGVVTMKTTHGRVSQAPDGAVMMGHAEYGALARHVEDVALFLDVASGPEPGDPVGCAPPSRRFTEAVTMSPPALRIGVFVQDTLGGTPVDPGCTHAVRQAGELLAGVGHSITDTFPAAYDDPEYLEHFIDMLAPGVVGILGYLSAIAGRPVTADEVEPSTRYWYERGLTRTGADLTADVMWMDAYRRTMANWWSQGYDLLVCPSFMRASLRLGELVEDGADATRANIDLIRATAPFNTTGQPALTVPITLIDGLPVGVQLVAAAGHEELLLQVGRQLQEVLGWTDNLRPPAAG